MTDYHQALQKSHSNLSDFWGKIGTTDSELISYLVNPVFQGAPRWPNARQSYRVVRTDNSVVIATDGLSDPGLSSTVNGFGLECYIETSDLVGKDSEAISSSWAFSLLEAFAQNIAKWEGVGPCLKKSDEVSCIELACNDGLPDSWLTERKTAPLIVNMATLGRSRQLEMPLSEIWVVPVTLIRPSEFEKICDQGQTALTKLIEALKFSGFDQLSTLDREFLDREAI